jgi:hypothetical protein
MNCDKGEVDPRKHAGPFKVLQEQEKGGARIGSAHCEACGNVVFRYLKPTGKDFFKILDAGATGLGH